MGAGNGEYDGEEGSQPVESDNGFQKKARLRRVESSLSIRRKPSQLARQLRLTALVMKRKDSTAKKQENYTGPIWSREWLAIYNRDGGILVQGVRAQREGCGEPKYARADDED